MNKEIAAKLSPGLTYAQAEIRVHRNLIIQSQLASKNEREVHNVPCLMAGVGGGKTSMAESQAALFELPLRAINNGENSDPTDVSGVPVPMMIRKLMLEGTDGEKHEAEAEFMCWVLNRYAAEACETGVFLFFWTHTALWFYREYKDRQAGKTRPHVQTGELPDIMASSSQQP